jgi:surfeit locus 1 family protein
LLFVPGALTFGLGTWQIFRRKDKIEMLEYRKKRLEMEPIKVNNIDFSSEKLDSLEFRKVVFKGTFDEKKSIYIGPRSRSISGVTENGYYIITPLMPSPGNPDSVQLPVLVNRGWVPRIWRDNALKASQDNEQPLKKPETIKDMEVVGVVRGSEKPSIFVPANDPSSFQWFYVDVPAIARACGLPENTVYIEDINGIVNPSNPYPLPKDSATLIRSSVMPQDHLNYMLTWYSLSTAVTFMAFKRLKQKKISRR